METPSLAILNFPPSRLPGPQLLHDIVRQNEAQDNAAIEFLSLDGTKETLSYEELHRKSDALAARISALTQSQSQDGQLVVPILAPQHPRLYVALLAILKAGGAFCPLNLDAPPERVKFILQDVAARIVITTPELASAIPQDESYAVLLLDDQDDQEPPLPTSCRLAEPTDLAYVMYTSGSTGTPKGVGVSHDAATQSLLAHDRHIPPFSRFLQFAAPTFDVSVFEIFFPLFRGSTLISCHRATMLNDLPSAIRAMDVDACELTPTVAGSLLRKRANAPCLRLLLTIGEMLTEPVIREFGGSDEVPSMLWAMYGPTEATIHCSLQPAFSSKSPVGNIGIPLDTVSAFVLRIPENPNGDKTTQLLNVGEVGELAIGGYQLASGYLNRPEQTASAFIDSPYGPLYRTGDKARLLPDGTLECLGRIAGGQVKLRGQRLELGEVEQAAMRTPGCYGAVAAVVGGILVLFCAVDDDLTDDMEAKIEQICKRWLPGFMVPGDIVIMQDFPKLASGKANRKQLVSDYTSRNEHEQDQQHERKFKDPLEQEICQIAGELLGCDILPTTSLPAAGLDSLIAIKFTSSLRQTGIDIGATDVLNSRTISQLCSLITRQRNGASGHPHSPVANLAPETLDSIGMDTIPILRDHLDGVEAVLPCTPLQSSMLAETASNQRAYRNWVELSCSGRYDQSTICSWIEELALKNEILRTGFAFHRGEFVQIVWRDSSRIPIEPIANLTHLARDFNISSEADFLRPFQVQFCIGASESRILLNIHHAVYDGWTIDLLLADLNTLSGGGHLEPRPNFRGVVNHARSTLQSHNSDVARSFWAEYLAGFQPVPFPKLLAATPRQPRTESRTLRIDVDPQNARQNLQQIECSPQVLFQASLAWLWSCYTGQEDIVVGCVSSGRTIPVTGIEDIMGPCIDTLPSRTNISQARTIRDFLGSIQAGNRAVLNHSSLPLADIKRSTGMLPGQSLYDVLFVYQESLFSRPRDGREIVQEVAHQDYLETKLLVEVEPQQGHYDCRFTYHTNALSDAVVTTIGEELQHVAQHVLANMDAEISSLRAVFPDHLLSTHNLGPQTFSGTPDLAKNVEEVVSRTPEKVAICFAKHITDGCLDAESISYRQLNSLSNRIARTIRSSGCSTGDVVAIVMEKSILLYAGILGIVKAGCSYLPLLPTTPRARIEVILTQAEAKMCLTDTSSSGNLPLSSGIQLVNLEDRGFEAFDDTNLDIPVDASRVANIIYTSGSTGVPKGVCVTQLNITSNLDVLSRIYPVKEDSALLQSCSQAFDVSVFEIFFAWTRGMRLCSASNDTLFEDLERSIRELGVTHLSMTPTVASLVNPQNVPNVEFLVTSGEPMTKKVAKAWGRQLYQGYGPSETTNICTVKQMGLDEGEVIQHLGFSFDNTSTVVLYQDSTGAVPRGCVGELCFGGDQVAQGYLKMPDLTATKFIDHPDFGRLYRSGDLGKMLPDGSLMIIGRVDDQVKLRGQRIELNEINTVVRESGTVSECITMLLKRQESSPDQLVSFYVLGNTDGNTSQPPDTLPLDKRIEGVTASIYQLLSAKVPIYMVPSYLVPLSKIPLTASGKLDRAWLRGTFQQLEQSYLEAISGKVETDQDDEQWTDLDRTVAGIVSSCLSVTEGGLTRWTPLVSLGLDSISAISLSRDLQKQLDCRVPVSLVLQNPCVARLAQAISEQSSSTASHDRITLDIFSDELVETIKTKCMDVGHAVEKILPSTPLQEAMLAASLTGKSYINNMLFRVYGDPNAMEEYWLAMCERHAIMRTCFASTDVHEHAFAQVVLAGWRPRWLHLDDADGSLDDCVSQHLASRGEVVDSMEPPVSFAFIENGGEVYLSFVCHHALYDGIAIERLLFEVEQLADGKSLEPPPTMEPFLREMLAGSTSSDGFWKEQLRDFSPTFLPRPQESSSGDVNRGHAVHAISANMPLSTIQERMKGFGCSLLSLCQATWASVLSTILQVDDICFANVVSCRSAAMERIDELVAPCFNTVPIRMDLSTTRQNSDLIQAFNTLSPQVLQHQFASLRRIQSLASSRHSQHLFDTLLLLQHPARTLDNGLWRLDRDDGEMDIPLVCEFIPSIEQNRLLIRLHYDCSSISTPMIDVVSDILQHSMSYIMNYSSSQILTASSLPTTLAGRLSGLVIQRSSSTTVETPVTSGAEEWSDVESRIRAVLAILSAAPEQRMKRQTTIYQLGLDSISAVQIASLLRKEGMAISASDVIEQKTCANIARKVLTSTAASHTNGARSHDFSEFQRQVEAELGEHGIHQASVEAILPCTSLQTGMLVQCLQSSGQDYLNFIDFQLDNGINIEDLRNAWTVLSNTHAMLRTGFIPVDSADFSFAMVQYRPGSMQALVFSLEDEVALRFSVENWRLDAICGALGQLHDPPWRAVLMNDGGKPMMYLAIHHALYDAQSLQRLLQDLCRLLRGEVLATVQPTAEAVQDIVGQERDLESRETFWKRLSGEVVINSFPTLTPLREDSRAILVESISSKHNFTSFEKSLRNSGFTMQAAVQAAWTRILSSYLGEASVTFGVVLSGRNSEATKDAVFPCISTLPVISCNKSSNRDLLQSMLQYSGQLYKQQHTPLTRIQRSLGYPDSRLFDTLLVYQKLADGTEAQLPWKVVQDQATVDYPVSIEVEPSQHDKLVYRITFFSDVIPREHATLLLEQFDAVLSHLALHPDGQETDLFSLAPDLFSVTPPEKQELPSPERFLHQFVEYQARKTPEKTALHFVFGSHWTEQMAFNRWSYQELDQRGNQVARMLLPHTKTGAIVAVYFDKCPEVYFAILGILKVGCAFVALDPGAPPSRKEFILKDSGASVLLTSKNNAVALDFAVDVPVLAFDEPSLSDHDVSPVTLNRELTPDDVCYCLYTSGTTGTPKGCEITHENAVQAMLAFQELFAGHWDETSRWLQFASFHFDVAVLEQYWSWSVGITLVAAPRDLILEDLARTISELEITHIDLTPSLARLLHPDDVPSLTRGVFITGGEQLKQEILDVWGSKGVIYNAYGPTEATIGVTTYPRVPRNGRSSNIGKQFVNVGSYVLKPGTETPVLRGGVGELCVSGKLVGKGYLNRQDLTTERFPALEAFNERVYRTGDLVRILHDGCFDFLGRADDQVKLRGQRLELGEINHTIRTGVPEVVDVATLVIRNEKQRKDILVSFVVAKSQSPAQQNLEIVLDGSASKISTRVQDACRARLPGYMVPTYVFSLPFIPLSSNNKAETRRLKALFNDLDSEQLMSLTKSINGLPAQLDRTGQKIARVLSTVEKVAIHQVTPDTSVFELGIDSISVMRFSTALKREGFPQATPALILKNPRLGDLAKALSSQDVMAVQDNTAAARQLVQAYYHRYRAQVERELCMDFKDVEYIAPCSPLQEGMITRSGMPGTEGAYFNVFRYELANEVSKSRLKKAWQKLVQSYPILRTRFIETDDGHIQVACKSIPLPWEESNLESQQTQDLESFLSGHHDKWLVDNARHILEPLKILVLNLDDGQRLLVIHIFHGLYDGTSMELMMDKLQDNYSQLPDTGDGPSYLEALVCGPLRNYRTSKDFWIKHLAGSSHRPMQAICQQPSDVDVSCTRQVSVPGLEALRVSLGVTHQAIIQAVWISVIQQLMESITIGIIVSGRSIDLAGVDEVIGPLFNTVPFHTTLPEGGTWASLIKTCHDFNIDILPFQHVPLRDVQKWCSGGKPLFDTLFSFQRAGPPKQFGDGQQLWTLVESPLNVDFPLAFEATLTQDDQLQLQLVAQGGIASHDALSGLLDQVEGALKAVLDPEQPISRQPHHQVNGFRTQDGVEPQTLPTPASISFEWTETAILLREEISQLVEVPVESITEHMSLLELGLDSIDMIKLSSRLRKRGIPLATSHLMKGQRISAIVNQPQLQEQRSEIQADSNGTSTNPDVSAVLRDYLLKNGQDLGQVEDVLPVTPLQDSMVAEMIQSDFHRYFNHDVLALDPGVEVDRLREAWNSVVENSPILRTTFVEVEDPSVDAAYCQLVNEASRLVVEETNLPDEDDFSQITEAARQRAVEGRGRSGLLQLAIVNKDNHRYLVLSIAHALYDGCSLGLLHQDVQSAYRGTYTPRPVYKEHLHQLVSTSTQEAKRFWTGFLAGADTTLVPAKRHIEETIPEGVHRLEVASSISPAEIRAYCKQHAISVQVLGQACWAAILATHTRSLDVTFGVVLSGRDTEEVEELMFPTMNTVAVRSVLHGNIRSWLLYMQENMTQIRTFQQFPLREAQKLAGNTNGPLFNSLFIQQIARDASSSQEKPLMVSVGGSSAVEYPVCVEFEVSGELVTWRTACGSRYLSRKETALLVHHLDAVLGFLVKSPVADVLSFTGREVSVCGLSPFAIGEQESKKEEAVTANGISRSQVWSGTEKEICSVLSEVSGVATTSIDRNHSIYHLGLDSISAIKVSSLLRKKGISLSARQMLGATSISEMADVASSSATTNGTVRDQEDSIATSLQTVNSAALLRAANIDASTIEEVLPATAMQVHMLSVWQNTSGAVFHPEFSFSLKGIIDQETIACAWLALVEHHAILRASFLATGSRNLPFIQVVRRYQAEMANITIDAGTLTSKILVGTSEPLVSLRISAVGKGSWYLQLKIHHALYDGVSLPIIVNTLRQLCRGIPPKPSNPGLAIWRDSLSFQVSSATQVARKAFWTNYLHDAKPLPSPRRTASPSPQNGRTSLLLRSAVKDLTHLQSSCSAAGISLQVLFFAVYAKYLARRTQTEDVIFGIYLANRTSTAGMDGLPYPTLSLVPLRVRQPRDFDIMALARVIQDDIHRISSPDNASVGLWEIFDWTGVKVDTFVNFLSLPDNGKAGKTDGVSLEGVVWNDGSPVGQKREASQFLEANPSLVSNSVADAYPDAVDVEVSVAGGSMDIGVFGPADVLDSAGAKEAILAIVDVFTAGN